MSIYEDIQYYYRFLWLHHSNLHLSERGPHPNYDPGLLMPGPACLSPCTLCKLVPNTNTNPNPGQMGGIHEVVRQHKSISYFCTSMFYSPYEWITILFIILSGLTLVCTINSIINVIPAKTNDLPDTMYLHKIFNLFSPLHNIIIKFIV